MFVAYTLSTVPDDLHEALAIGRDDFAAKDLALRWHRIAPSDITTARATPALVEAFEYHQHDVKRGTVSLLCEWDKREKCMGTIS